MLVKNHYNPDVIGVATQFDPTQPIYDFETNLMFQNMGDIGNTQNLMIVVTI